MGDGGCVCGGRVVYIRTRKTKKKNEWPKRYIPHMRHMRPGLDGVQKILQPTSNTYHKHRTIPVAECQQTLQHTQKESHGYPKDVHWTSRWIPRTHPTSKSAHVGSDQSTGAIQQHTSKYTSQVQTQIAHSTWLDAPYRHPVSKHRDTQTSV